MQDESVGPSRQMDSDPTEQPDNVRKKSVTTEEQKYELKRKQRNLERESLKKKLKQKNNKRYMCDKCGKLFANLSNLKRHKRTFHNNGKEASKPKQDCGSEGKRKRLEWNHSDADLKSLSRQL
ncbi:GDNF-inducible zinc finger protein 1-like [Nylanderia fulva]|uniref:GDNF-inducible zinc finger protein 1-like n=1 Tax=Nylanderia fulva TaxID=613905 RepID=UPI0010FB271C|nr:GDNF-inducible zinc finger protein 1-like [Nylanderia fulva]